MFMVFKNSFKPWRAGWRGSWVELKMVRSYFYSQGKHSVLWCKKSRSGQRCRGPEIDQRSVWLRLFRNNKTGEFSLMLPKTWNKPDPWTPRWWWWPPTRWAESPFWRRFFSLLERAWRRWPPCSEAGRGRGCLLCATGLCPLTMTLALTSLVFWEQPA